MFQVLRTDIVMDVGHSLNPAIDVGQIEGAFVQSYGMLVLEQYKVTGQGKLLTNGPGNYKIPAFSNIPHNFNVTLLKNKGNPKAVYSSKGIGEPPQCLAISAFLAIKSAISAARSDTGHTGHFQLDSPATPDKIRMACIDQFSQQFLTDDAKDKMKPWFVQL
uniref:Aldehyde oxidase/xanthine dehydrogenase second molybdopterin binding domain-containing protein n=1 Tax=Arion vulgaris TaxID=1028688 RepID=A0A0B6ZIS6_9EUPU